MGLGTFVGVRLTEAREAMGLNLTSLANLVGVSYQMVSSYESGLKQPSEGTLARICTILNQPVHFFFHDGYEQGYRHDSVYFRAQQSLRTDLREQVGTRLKWMIEYYIFLNRMLVLPEVNFPNLDPPNDPTLISRDLIEDAAVSVRRLWDLGSDPLPNMIRLLERNGAVVGQISMNLPKMDGASIWSQSHGRPFILLNADKASYVRSRFDAAHELGHMILHRNIPKGLTQSAMIYKRMEEQAHWFASAMLLPRDLWLHDIHSRGFTLASFKTLKPKWHASIFSMIMRSTSLGEISEERKVNLIKQLSSRGWRTREPYDELWELEVPKLLGQATRMLIDSGIGVETILHSFPRSVDNLSELTGLARAYFNADSLPISRLN